MPVSDEEVIKVVVEFELGSDQIGQNVYHFKADLAATQSNASVLTAIETWVEDLYDNIAAQMSDAYEMRPGKVDIVEYDDVTEKWETTENIGYYTPTVPFTNISDPLPNQNAPVLVGDTNLPRSKGRKFMPAFTDTTADGSILTSAATTALAAALVDYLADAVIDGSNFFEPGIASLAAGIFLKFVSGSVQDVVFTQRRRVPGVGM